jgi:hypothetical protein
MILVIVLKLCGIGNKTDLESFGIETIVNVDLPGVGSNLRAFIRSHPQIPGS